MTSRIKWETTWISDKDSFNGNAYEWQAEIGPDEPGRRYRYRCIYCKRFLPCTVPTGVRVQNLEPGGYHEVVKKYLTCKREACQILAELTGKVWV